MNNIDLSEKSSFIGRKVFSYSGKLEGTIQLIDNVELIVSKPKNFLSTTLEIKKISWDDIGELKDGYFTTIPSEEEYWQLPA